MHFTKTETLRRLRVLAAEMRDITSNGRGAPVEIGLRTIPVATPTAPTQSEAYDDDDDLDYFVSFAEGATAPEVSGYGSVVHIYLSRMIGFCGRTPLYELDSTCVGWMGTPDAEPVVIDSNGTPVSRAA